MIFLFWVIWSFLQVEAALTSDPTNEELLQLKQDLSQVIELTSQLVNSGTVPEPEPEPKVIKSDKIYNSFNHLMKIHYLLQFDFYNIYYLLC